MNNPSLCNVSSSSAANGARTATHGLSPAACAAIAGLVLAACGFTLSGPAAAADSERASYCLTSDSRNDCGFASLAQCEATAAGGLGECSMVAASPDPRSAYALYRSPVKLHKVSR